MAGYDCPLKRNEKNHQQTVNIIHPFLLYWGNL
jgi:hypothetical protein